MLAISVPELSVLVSVDKAQSDSSSSSPRALVTSEASTSGASIDIEKSTSSLACTATVEDNLLISVKNGSMIEDESTPDRVVQQLEGAVIVTVIDIFFLFSISFHISIGLFCLTIDLNHCDLNATQIYSVAFAGKRTVVGVEE